jgi:hypothetical protein
MEKNGILVGFQWQIQKERCDCADNYVSRRIILNWILDIEDWAI